MPAAQPSPESILADLERLLEDQEDVGFAYLFGSFAKGRSRAASDLDVAVWFLEPEVGSAPAADRADRALVLQAVLERELRRPVQVVELNRSPTELTHNVLRHGRLILSRAERDRTRFYVAHARRYYDLAPARRLFGRYMSRRIEEGTFGGGSGHGS